jgi:hypothetical protein
MTAAGFRRVVLTLAGATEGSHMGHPDFRLNGRIFATLHEGGRTGMVKVSPETQQELVGERPDVFAPESGAWGRQGCTRVHLARGDEEVIGAALTLAWQHAARTPVTPRKRANRGTS